MTFRPESLHNHTIESDGKQTHLELLHSAEEFKYGAVAFTDHDQLPQPHVLEQLKAYSGPVKWLIGTELTSAMPKEAEEPSTLHILGLFVDPENKALSEHCDVLRESRILRMRHYVKHLTSLGFTITEEDCMRVAGESMVGNPHIVDAVLSHPGNRVVQEKIMKRMEAKGRQDPETAWKYERMVAEGERQFPYVLYMKKTSFMPAPEGDYQGTLLDLDESVKLIREAGGVALLAHWFFEQKKLPKPVLEKLLEDKRLDGVETENKNLILERDISKEVEYLNSVVARYNCIGAIGSDGHDHYDMENFAKSEAGERSAGQTQAIIDRVKPDLSWTNFQ